MNVKITIPTSLNDITIGQYQAIRELLKDEDLKGKELDNEILRIVLGFENVEGIAKKDRNNLIKDIETALEKEGNFNKTFKLKDVTFGMIPNYDAISNGEYIDLIKYSENEEDLHRLLAVCYRPIRGKDIFNNYQIEEYNGTGKYADIMKELPMSIAKGCRGFFLTLSEDLEIPSLMFTEVELKRELVL